MTSVPPQPADPTGTLDTRRIGAARAARTALTASNDGTPDGSFHFDDDEREDIARAVRQSPHPRAGFARTVLDQWDHLDADDRVAGLLLFAEIVNQPHRQRSISQGMER